MIPSGMTDRPLMDRLREAYRTYYAQAEVQCIAAVDPRSPSGWQRPEPFLPCPDTIGDDQLACLHRRGAIVPGP